MREMTRRGLGVAVGAGALALASRGVAWGETAADASSDLLAPVNPELRPLLAGDLAMFATMPPLSRENLSARRAPLPVRPGRAPLETPAFTTRMIPGHGGAPDVRIYVINAGAGAAPKPAILHMHGGGYVAGTPLDVMRYLQDMAAALDCVIVSVDYRLAPETPFPGSLEDNYSGLKWLHDNADALGADRGRIAVMGESAGGGHAAILAIAARDRGEVPLVYQALTYPMLDDRTGSTRAVPPHIGAILWRRADNRFGWTSFLGVPAGSRRTPPGASPARVENLQGLPPAFIGVGSIDLFVDEDIEYARRLIDAGVPTELVVVPGAFHAFDFFGPSPLVDAFNAARLNALKSALAAR